MTNGAALQAQWDALKLQLFTPRPLSAEQLQILRYPDQHDPDYSKHFPLIIARIKPEVNRKIMGFFQQTPENCLYHSGGLSPFKPGQAIYKAFLHDARSLSSLMTGRKPFDTQMNVFTYYKPRFARLHRDRPDDPHGLAILTRLGRLPFSAIPGSILTNADGREERDDLIMRASQNPPDQTALRRLRHDKVLRAIGLGQLAVILTGRQGTLHASAPVHRPTQSVFMRSQFRPPR